MKAWIDVETTGLDPKANDIVQIACIIPEVNFQFKSYVRPFDFNSISERALEVNGFSVRQLKGFSHPIEVMNAFTDKLMSLGTRYVFSGYNVEFDKSFLYRTMEKCKLEGKWDELFSPKIHCTFERAKSIGKKRLGVPNLKLTSLCDRFGHKYNAHDAFDDISATIHVDSLLAPFERKPLTQESLIEGILEQEAQKDPRGFLGPEYVVFNGDGDVFITKKACRNQEAIAAILAYLAKIHGVSLTSLASSQVPSASVH